jgi:hypothetical protein
VGLGDDVAVTADVTFLAADVAFVVGEASKRRWDPGWSDRGPVSNVLRPKEGDGVPARMMLVTMT